jgi:hypothetical protein
VDHVTLTICYYPRLLTIWLGWLVGLIALLVLLFDHKLFLQYTTLAFPLGIILTLCFLPTAASACLDILFALQMRNRNEFHRVKALLEEGWRQGPEPATFLMTVLKYVVGIKWH